MNRIGSTQRITFDLFLSDRKCLSSHLSAKPPSHRFETTIGSKTSSLPEIVKPNGPLQRWIKNTNHFLFLSMFFFSFFTLVEVIGLCKRRCFPKDYLQNNYHLFLFSIERHHRCFLITRQYHEDFCLVTNVHRLKEDDHPFESFHNDVRYFLVLHD